MRSTFSNVIRRSLSSSSPSSSSFRILSSSPSSSSSSSSSLSSSVSSFSSVHSLSRRWIATEQSSTMKDPSIPTSEKVDYYKVLGISRTANVEDIKQAFREQAKIHHPDAKRVTSDQDITIFKLINEAYTILSDPVKRKEYDRQRYGGRSVSLRSRNEGNSAYEFERPTSIYAAGPHWQTLKGTPAAGGPEGPSSSSSLRTSGSNETTDPNNDPHDPNLPMNTPPPPLPPVNFTPEDSQEAFRLSMERANERLRQSSKNRATLARLNRTKVEMPTYELTLTKFMIPVGVIGLWIANYVLFMK